MSDLLNAGIVEMNGDRSKMKLIRNVPSATALTGRLRGCAKVGFTGITDNSNLIKNRNQTFFFE